jgi:hypothetical protein
MMPHPPAAASCQPSGFGKYRVGGQSYDMFDANLATPVVDKRDATGVIGRGYGMA